MNKIDVKFKILKDGHLPTYKHPGDSCMDCYASLEESVQIKPRDKMVIPLGFCMELPEGYEAVVRPRSGLSSKDGIMAVIGTIDSPYRNEVGGIIYNFSDKPFTVNEGDRICQIKVQPTYNVNPIIVDELSSTDRGSGFGSSGI